jgi:hypothetical protein
MGLEAPTFIHQLNAAWPIGASDPKGQGDDHLRNIKAALQATFANVTGAVTASHTELNLLTGKTGTVWTSANDGAGTGLDADTVDGVQLSNLAQLDQQNTFSLSNAGIAIQTIQNTNNGAGAAKRVRIRNDANHEFALQLTSSTYNGAATLTGGPAAAPHATLWVSSNLPLSIGQNSTERVRIDATGLDVTNAVGNLKQQGANVIDIPSRAGTFARGQCCSISAGITLNTSDMATGSTFSIYNNSAAAITITQGAGVTLRLAGTATTGNRTLAARGFATIWCVSGTEAVCMGNVS